MKKFLFVLLLALLPLLAACHQQARPPLMFGADAWPGYAALYLASAQGYLPPQGIRLAEYGNSAEVMQAFRNHALQVAGVTLDEALLLRRDIPDLKIVLLLATSNGADAVLAQPGIGKLSELRGKRIGVENKVGTSYFLGLALQQAGLDAHQITMVPLPPDKLEAAFRAHQVDAVVVSGAAQARLLQAGAVQLFDSSQTPGQMLDVLVTRDEYIGDYYQELTQLLQGWRRAVDYLRTEPSQAMQVLARRAQTDPAQFAQAMQGIELLGLRRNRELLLGEPPAVAPTIDKVQRFMLDNGRLQLGSDAAALLDTSLLANLKQ
jgi:NitT/TauT family transport system substrate-binding protein